MEDGRDPTILIVDDEVTICQLMQKLLRRSGYHSVLVANTGRDALKLLGLDEEAQAPTGEETLTVTHVDLVLLDIMLPDVTGYEVCTRIKQAYGSRLPVILLTGFTIEENHARYLEAGADDFITKPFDRQSFLTRVQIAVERKLQAERAAQERTAALNLPGREPGSSYIGGIIGNCYVEELIWCGAASVICKAFEGDDTARAIKLLTHRVAEFPDVVRRFDREIQVLAEMQHENVACLISHGVHFGSPYFVMEYVDGNNLAAQLKADGAFSFERVLQLAKGVAEGLRYIHSKNVVHRDVTLGNVVADDDGETVKIIDFGISIDLSEPQFDTSAFCVGTPLYMAPEMFTGAAVSPATDVYSYGTCLYYLITGTPPFDASNTAHLINNHISGTAEDMSSRRKNVPEEWDEFITKQCLAKRPEDRPQSMDDVLKALAELEQKPF